MARPQTLAEGNAREALISWRAHKLHCVSCSNHGPNSCPQGRRLRDQADVWTARVAAERAPNPDQLEMDT